MVSLRWDDIDFQTGKLHVRRAKGGTASVHPIGGRELRALRRLKREAPASIYVFVSERLAPLSVAGYQRMVARAGESAGFPFLVHSHMLRHSCGYKLANDGQDTRAIQHYLGHARSHRQSAIRHWRLIGLRGSGRTRSSHYPACREMEPAMSLLNAGVLVPWPKGTAFSGHFRGRGVDDVWPGFSVAAFKKDKRL